MISTLSQRRHGRSGRSVFRIVAVVAAFFTPLQTTLAGELPWIKPADNALLGGWQLVEETDLDHVGGRCATGMTFEATRQTVFQGDAGTIGEARYYAHNGLIVVPGKNASVDSGLVSYRFVDRNHIERRDYLLCRYQRGNPSQQAAAAAPSDCPSQEVLDQMQHPEPGTSVTYEQAMEIIRCEK